MNSLDDYWFEQRYQDAYYAIHGEFAPDVSEEER